MFNDINKINENAKKINPNISNWNRLNIILYIKKFYSHSKFPVKRIICNI